MSEEQSSARRRASQARGRRRRRIVSKRLLRKMQLEEVQSAAQGVDLQAAKTKTKKRHSHSKCIFKRRKRKQVMDEQAARSCKTRRPLGARSTIGNVLLVAIFVRSILCDTSAAARRPAPSSQHRAEPPPPFSRFGAELVNLQRFVEEPRDALVMAGQTVEFGCVVENRLGDVRWYRDELGMGVNTLFPEFHARYELAQRHQAGEQQPDGAWPTFNWTMRLKDVKLGDDAEYSCAVDDADPQHRHIRSRRARLTIVRPPAKLALLDSLEASAESGDANQLGAHTTYASLQPVESVLAASTGEQRHTSGVQIDVNGRPVDRQSSRNQDEVDEHGVRVLTVRQDDRLRLECRVGPAKPQAELVWLDQNQQEISTGGANASDVELEQRVSMDDHEPSLFVASLVLSFRVQRNHTNHVFECKARHLAFEQPSLFPQLYGRELQGQVRLNVLFKPEIEDLAKEPQLALEGHPVRFACVAHAKPNQLTYRWLIDDQPVANATDSELYIAKLTRQMHLRVVKCQVSNSVGTSTVIHQLVVRYAPAFVTHLLQPSSASGAADQSSSSMESTVALESDDYDEIQHQPASSAARHEKQAALHQQRVPSRPEFVLARQLARSFKSGQNVRLRCDFDANPMVQFITWYKISVQQRELLKDVTPVEADELIAVGEARASFLEPEGELGEMSVMGDNQQYADYVNSERQYQLDYKQMSAVLIDELDSFTEQQQQQQQVETSGPSSWASAVEPMYTIVANGTPTQNNYYIQEPLAWTMRPTALNMQSQHPAAHPSQPADSHTSYHHYNHQQHLPADEQRAASNQLVLMQPSRSDTDLGPAALSKRRAPVSSSFISFTNVNNETMGKYVCRTKSADGVHTSSAAQSILLVPKNRPRIVSAKEQWAASNKAQVQVECLAQISTNWDTTFTWTRDGKTTDALNAEHSGAAGEEKYKIVEQRSPDMLFMRSILRINRPTPGDEGVYTCRVSNAFGPPDDMDIRLRYSMPTGFAFAVIATLAIGSILLLACVVGLVIVCAPRPPKLEAKLAALAGGNQEPMASGSSDTGSQASDRKSPQLMVDASAANHGDHGSSAGICGVSQSQQPQQQAQQNDECYLDAKLMNDPKRQLMSHFNKKQQAATIYDRGDSSDSNIAQRQHHPQFNEDQHKLRTSLRQTTTNGANNRMGKYAAIQESLEHKLHLHQPPFGPPRQVQSEMHELDGQQRKHHSLQRPADGGHGATSKAQTVSELERGSLVNRLWARLLMRPERSIAGGFGGSRRVKSRPVISMPVSSAAELNQTCSGSKRSSLSTSLSILGDGSANEMTEKRGSRRRKSVNLNHSNGGHLLSSSANLIQGSATGSDGTACSSSSRSSSSSGQNHHDPLNSDHLHLQPQLRHHAHTNSMDYNAPNNYLPQQAMWMHPPATSIPSGGYELNPIEHGTNHQLTDCGVYVDELTANHNGTYQPVTSNNQQLYTNGHLVASSYPAQVPVQSYVTPLPTNDQPQWSPESNQATIGHYQHPMIIQGETYFPAQHPNGQQPCYATICTKPTPQVQFQPTTSSMMSCGSINNSNNNNNTSNYGTLPARPASQQCLQMVPTSDAGDAFYEDNYGTLLSSAYKTLGYATPTATSIKQHGHASSSASTSPNSLTTNRSNPLPSSSQLHQDQSMVMNGDKTHQLTFVQADGSSTAANNSNNDNGQATHV